MKNFELIGAAGALMDKGAIKIRNFRGNTRKLSYAYILTPHGLAEKASLTATPLARADPR